MKPLINLNSCYDVNPFHFILVDFHIKLNLFSKLSNMLLNSFKAIVMQIIKNVLAISILNA